MDISLIKILANLFVAFKENIKLASIQKQTWCSTQDLSIFMLKNSSELNNFHHEISRLNSNLQFTLQILTDGRLLILDTEMKLISNRLHTHKANRHQSSNAVH